MFKLLDVMYMVYISKAVYSTNKYIHNTEIYGKIYLR